MAMKRHGLVAARMAVGLTQEELADRLRVERSTVQRWEAGETTPQAWCWPKLGKALGVSRAKLIELLTSPPTTPAGPSKASVGEVFGALSADERDHVAAALDQAGRFLDGTVVEAFGRQLAACQVNDGTAGPKATLPVVLGVVGAIEQTARDTAPAVRRDLLAVGARAAEFAGWLYRDIRNPARAAYWRDRATEWAQEAGDLPMQGYILLKKAQAAYDDREALRMLTLSQAAQEGPWQLPVRVRAEVAQQVARGHAMLGDRHQVVAQRLAEAEQLLDQVGSDDAAALGAHYSPTVLTMQTAICLTEAGQPRRAIELYQQWLTTSQFSPRDYGYFLSLMATSLGLAGEPDQAATTAVTSRTLAKETNSRRTLTELNKVVAILQPWKARTAVRELEATLLV
jgi:transcriptional regulator with XRE-family HTH domain